MSQEDVFKKSLKKAGAWLWILGWILLLMLVIIVGWRILTVTVISVLIIMPWLVVGWVFWRLKVRWKKRSQEENRNKF